MLDIFCQEASSGEVAHRWPVCYVPTSASFGEVEAFIQKCVTRYPIELWRCEATDLRVAFQAFLRRFPEIRAIFVGVRRTDPGCSNLHPFERTDGGWPDFVRIHPILDWSYGDVWWYLRTFSVPYCSLYDQGYTSLGDRARTIPNPLLCDPTTGQYRPAHCLADESQERAGRLPAIALVAPPGDAGTRSAL